MCAARRSPTGQKMLPGFRWGLQLFEHIKLSRDLTGCYFRHQQNSARWRGCSRWHRRGSPRWSMHWTCHGASNRCSCWTGLTARESETQHELRKLMWMDFCLLAVLRQHLGFRLRADFGVCGCPPGQTEFELQVDPSAPTPHESKHNP